MRKRKLNLMLRWYEFQIMLDLQSDMIKKKKNFLGYVGVKLAILKT